MISTVESNCLAISVSSLIFLATLYSASKKWISFPVTALFLFFSISVGLIIANHKLIQYHLSKQVLVEKETDNDVKAAHFHEHILHIYDDLKMNVEIHNHQLQAMNEEIKTLQKKNSDQE